DDFSPVYSFSLMLMISIVNLLIVIRYIPVKTNPDTIKQDSRLPVYNDEKRETAEISSTRAFWSLTFALVLIALTYSFVKGYIIGILPNIEKHEKYWNWNGFQAGIVLFIFGLARTITFLFQSYFKKNSYLLSFSYSFGLSGSLMLLIFTKDFYPICFISALIGWLTGLVYASSLEKLLHITKQGKGLSAGIFESMMGIGAVSSSVIGGFALQSGGPNLSFIITGLVSVMISISAVALYFLYKHFQQ
ncbi:MAG: hypothetical protein ACTSXU_13430, partial [Promethearchaeota archaeon]